MILTSWFAFVLKMTNIHIQKMLMDEKWSPEKHKTNEVFETLNFLHVQAFYFDGMFASQVNTNNVSIQNVGLYFLCLEAFDFDVSGCSYSRYEHLIYFWV